MYRAYEKHISIPSIIKIGEGELHNIGHYLEEAGFKKVACFYSLGIKAMVGESIQQSFKKYGITLTCDDEIDDINIDTIVHRAFTIPKEVDALIGIGGGKALDYSKYAAHILALPFISIPTSTSNDGFCSPMSSLVVEGHRKSVNSSIPYGVVVDIDIIKTSPELCIYSGIGDLVSKITAGWDWTQAHELNNEDYSDFAHLISFDSVSDIIYTFQNDIREPRFLTQLVKSLLMNGLSMEIAGSSRPASGSEHLISHAYDKLTDYPRMHGLQVGVATYVCAYLQGINFSLIKELFDRTGFFTFLEQDPLDKKTFIEAIKIAPSVKENFYSVLTPENNRKRAMDFVEKDAICQKILA